MSEFPSNPSERNSSIIALIMKHLHAAGAPLEYTVLTSIVRDDTGLTEVEVNGTIIDTLFALIGGGIIACSTRDSARQRTALGFGTMLSLPDRMQSLMSQTNGKLAEPGQPYYGTKEIDDLVNACETLGFYICNYPDSGKCTLTFSINPGHDVTPQMIEAAQELTRRFDEDEDVRQAIIDVDLSDGGCFVSAGDSDLGFRLKPYVSAK